jgi:hypothetical protein
LFAVELDASRDLRVLIFCFFVEICGSTVIEDAKETTNDWPPYPPASEVGQRPNDISA